MTLLLFTYIISNIHLQKIAKERQTNEDDSAENSAHINLFLRNFNLFNKIRVIQLT